MIRPSGPAVARSLVLLAVLMAPFSAAATDIGVSSAIAEIELSVDLFDEDVPLGGLSGLTYDPGCDLFYALTDDRGYIAAPRVYAFKLELDGPGVRPIEVITLLDGPAEAFTRGVLDPEAVALAPNGVLWVATEGEDVLDLGRGPRRPHGAGHRPAVQVLSRRHRRSVRRGLQRCRRQLSRCE